MDLLVAACAYNKAGLERNHGSSNVSNDTRLSTWPSAQKGHLEHQRKHATPD